MISPSRILDSLKNLPTLPNSVFQLQQVLQDERSSVADMERVVRPDPALTANLLRLANSAYFGLPRAVSSARQAIMLLGARRTFEVAASAGFAQLIPDVLPGYALRSRDFWLHSIAVAVLSERLALELGLATVEMVFTAGLLHDLGKLALGVFLEEEAHRVLDSVHGRGLSFVDAEAGVLGMDHTDVGGRLAERWRLPGTIADAVRWHHRPEDAPPGADPNLVTLIHVADGLAHVLGLGADVGELARGVDTAAAENLGVKVQRLERVACETLEEIKEMAAVLEDHHQGESAWATTS